MLFYNHGDWYFSTVTLYISQIMIHNHVCFMQIIPFVKVFKFVLSNYFNLKYVFCLDKTLNQLEMLVITNLSITAWV